MLHKIIANLVVCKIKLVSHVIVEMAPSTNTNRGKELADEVSNTASNMGEPAQGDMLLTM